MSDDDNATEEQAPETQPCPHCLGFGSANTQVACDTCNGSGRIPK